MLFQNLKVLWKERDFVGIGICLFAADIGLLLFATMLKALFAQLNKAKCPDCKKQNVTNTVLMSCCAAHPSAS